jgi:hypothetical protein
MQPTLTKGICALLQIPPPKSTENSSNCSPALASSAQATSTRPPSSIQREIVSGLHRRTSRYKDSSDPHDSLQSLRLDVHRYSPPPIDPYLGLFTYSPPSPSTDPTIQVSPAELVEVVASFKDTMVPKKVNSTGIYIAGEKYITLKADEESLYGKKVCI